MEVRFIFTSSSGRPRVHTKRLPVIMGRSDGGDVKLRIPRDAISRRHCEFLLDESGLVCVRDLESTNGTFLEGRRLEPRVAKPVASGSVVKLGNVSFRVEYAARGSGDESDTTPIAAAAESPSESVPPAAPETITAAEGLPIAERAAAERPAATDFDFLAAAEPEARPSPGADGRESPLAGDKNLEDFFKGLS